jgi:hypothetical protein
MASSLPYTLSAEDAALFKRLQDSALLPETAKPGEGALVQLFKQQKKQEQKTIIEPYADLLEAELKMNLANRKADILAELKASKSSTFTAKLFSWNSVSYYEAIWEQTKRIAAMSQEEQRAYHDKMADREYRIKVNKWETMFRVEKMIYIDDDEYSFERARMQYYDSLLAVKVDRIFRQSDLGKRLSLTLGPNFFPYITWTPIEGASEEGDDGFQVYQKTLCVRYYPFGVAKLQMEQLLKTAKEQAKRKAEGKIRTLESEETCKGHQMLFVQPLVRDDDDYADMPSLVRAVPEDDERCFCGCAAQY